MSDFHNRQITDVLFGKLPLADKGTNELTRKMFSGLTIAVLFENEQMKKINDFLAQKKQKALAEYLISLTDYLKTKKTNPKFVYEKICEVYNLKPYSTIDDNGKSKI